MILFIRRQLAYSQRLLLVGLKTSKYWQRSSMNLVRVLLDRILTQTLIALHKEYRISHKRWTRIRTTRMVKYNRYVSRSCRKKNVPADLHTSDGTIMTRSLALPIGSGNKVTGKPIITY